MNCLKGKKNTFPINNYILQSPILFSCPEFYTSQYKPIALDVAHPKDNCVSACLSTIIMGNRTQVGKFEKLFVKLRTGSDKHLYDRPGKVMLSRGIEYVKFINTTDIDYLPDASVLIFMYIMTLATTNNLTILF